LSRKLSDTRVYAPQIRKEMKSIPASRVRVSGFRFRDSFGFQVSEFGYCILVSGFGFQVSGTRYSGSQIACFGIWVARRGAIWRCLLSLPLKSSLIYQVNGSNAKPMAPTCAESSDFACAGQDMAHRERPFCTPRVRRTWRLRSIKQQALQA